MRHLSRAATGDFGGFDGFNFNGGDMGDIFGDIFGDLFGAEEDASIQRSHAGANLVHQSVRITLRRRFPDEKGDRAQPEG